jgi:hypothetical protein
MSFSSRNQFISVLLIAVFVLTSGCSRSSKQPNVAIKRMPDLHYAHWTEPDTSSAIDDQISSSLELYGLDPESFGDPLGIVQGIPDSVGIGPRGRIMGIIVTAPGWKGLDGVSLDTISGGVALVCDCAAPLDKLDSCWNLLSDYARRYSENVVPPGIEIYRDFDAENTNDTVVTELIIRVR